MAANPPGRPQNQADPLLRHSRRSPVTGVFCRGSPARTTPLSRRASYVILLTRIPLQGGPPDGLSTTKNKPCRLDIGASFFKNSKVIKKYQKERNRAADKQTNSDKTAHRAKRLRILRKPANLTQKRRFRRTSVRRKRQTEITSDRKASKEETHDPYP